MPPSTRAGRFSPSRQVERLLGDSVPIPAEIPGDTQTGQARELRYLYLAAQVRLSYPTAAWRNWCSPAH